MRRLLQLAAVGALLVPAAAAAQARLMVGCGLTAPSGNLSDQADAGYHAAVGLHVDIPRLPVGIRGTGVIHKLGAANATVDDTGILGGSLSLVFTMPGIGLQPYFLGGVGQYRVEAGPVAATVTDTYSGYHGGFGVVIGGLGPGAFAELRYVRVEDPMGTRLIPLTVGLRF